MLANKLVTYESWNLEKPTIPSHSHLYHLEPIGMGTPYIESLTGYIARLAEVHCVPTGILVLKELGSFIKKGYVFSGKEGGLDQIFAKQIKALNGTGAWVISTIQALESLTLQNNLCFLTMLHWAEVIPQRSLLRSVRAWCPICYQNWYTTEQTIYEPLLWTLNAITICPHHHQPLCTYCPYCQQNNRLLAWRSRPGYCSKCQEWLGILSNAELPEKLSLTENELKWQTWVIKNLGDLIAVAPRFSAPPKEKIAKNLAAYVHALADDNISAFARQIGINRTQAERWCTGNTQPTIDILLQICFHLKTSLVDFLIQDLINIDFDTINKVNNYQQKSNTRSTSRQINNSGEVQQALETALTENPPPSIIEVAKRLGYKRSTVLYYHSSDLCYAITQRHIEYEKSQRLQRIQHLLQDVLESKDYPPPSMQKVAESVGISFHALKRNFPELCRAISAQYASYRREQRTKRVDKVSQEVRQIALKLHAEGVEPTASRISVYMTKPGSILQKEAIAAVREVRSELGWEK